MSIIIIRNGVAARVPPAEFALEGAMQEQIAANPSILPLHEVREGAELVAVVRELSVASGSIDLLGFDAEGEIYVIETKLARNPDRRTVVTQALDYGAALWIRYPEPAGFVAAVNELRMRAERRASATRCWRHTAGTRRRPSGPWSGWPATSRTAPSGSSSRWTGSRTG